MSLPVAFQQGLEGEAPDLIHAEVGTLISHCPTPSLVFSLTQLGLSPRNLNQQAFSVDNHGHTTRICSISQAQDYIISELSHVTIILFISWSIIRFLYKKS